MEFRAPKRLPESVLVAYSVGLEGWMAQDHHRFATTHTFSVGELGLDKLVVLISLE